jgi:hypothetical protein
MKIIKKFLDYLYILYMSNPILNPSIMSVQPITTKNSEGKRITRYRLSKRNHGFDSWKIIGDFSSFSRALEEGLK